MLHVLQHRHRHSLIVATLLIHFKNSKPSGAGTGRQGRFQWQQQHLFAAGGHSLCLQCGDNKGLYVSLPSSSSLLPPSSLPPHPVERWRRPWVLPSALPGPAGGKYRNIITQVNMDFLPPTTPPSRPPPPPPSASPDCVLLLWMLSSFTRYVPPVFSVDSSIFRTRAEITICLEVQMLSFFAI